MDVATTRLLSIHVAALLPPTSTELDVAHNIQVAAVLGVGLVYQNTAHRHISEVLLSEIGKHGAILKCYKHDTNDDLRYNVTFNTVDVFHGVISWKIKRSFHGN